MPEPALSRERPTSAPDAVWRLWTTPPTWGDWDAGLRSGPVVEGVRGVLVDTTGRRSRYTVTGFDRERRCEVTVNLPAARMVLTRTLQAHTARHEVAFAGPLGRVWAALLVRRFRPLLGPTVEAAVTQAAADAARG